jgi:hypothetical protein
MNKLRIGALALALLMCFTVTAPAVRAALADSTPATADGSMPPMIEGGPDAPPSQWLGWLGLDRQSDRGATASAR